MRVIKIVMFVRLLHAISPIAIELLVLTTSLQTLAKQTIKPGGRGTHMPQVYGYMLLLMPAVMTPVFRLLCCSGDPPIVLVLMPFVFHLKKKIFRLNSL